MKRERDCSKPAAPNSLRDSRSGIMHRICAVHDSARFTGTYFTNPRKFQKIKAECPYCCLTSSDYRVRSIYAVALGLVIFVDTLPLSLGRWLPSRERPGNNRAHREDNFNLQPVRVRRPVNLL